MPSAARSLMLPPGLRNSSFANRAAAVPGTTRASCNMGVWPTSWVISEAILGVEAVEATTVIENQSMAYHAGSVAVDAPTADLRLLSFSARAPSGNIRCAFALQASPCPHAAPSPGHAGIQAGLEAWSSGTQWCIGCECHVLLRPQFRPPGRLTWERTQCRPFRRTTSQARAARGALPS